MGVGRGSPRNHDFPTVVNYRGDPRPTVIAMRSLQVGRLCGVRRCKNALTVREGLNLLGNDPVDHFRFEQAEPTSRVLSKLARAVAISKAGHGSTRTCSHRPMADLPFKPRPAIYFFFWVSFGFGFEGGFGLLASFTIIRIVGLPEGGRLLCLSLSSAINSLQT